MRLSPAAGPELDAGQIARAVRLIVIDNGIEEAWNLKFRETEQARELADEAIRHSNEIGYQQGVVRGTIVSAAIDLLYSRFNQARSTSRQLLRYFREHHDRLWEARTLLVLGSAYHRIDDSSAALHAFQAALQIGVELDNRQIEATVLVDIGNLLRSSGDYQGSLDRYRRSHQIAVDAGLTEQEAVAAYSIAAAYVMMGDDRTALPYLNRSAELVGELGHRRMSGIINGLYGMIRAHAGDSSSALRFELEALEIYEETGNSHGACDALIRIGHHYQELGAFDSALDAMMQALDICRSHNLKESQSIVLVRIGSLYERFEDGSMVLDYYRHSLRVAEEARSQYCIGVALYHIGCFFRDHGAEPKGLVYLLRCLRMQQNSESRADECSALQAVGKVYQKLGDYRTAREYLEKSVEIVRDTGGRDTLIRALTALGGLENETGHFDRAGRHLREALLLAREVDHLDLGHIALQQLLAGAMLEGDQRKRRDYERQVQEVTEKIFNAGATRRVRKLIDRFKEEYIRREGVQLGLDDEDLARVDQAVARWRGMARENRTPTTTALPETSHPMGEATRHSSGSPIQITTFGAFRITIDGVEIPKSAWGRKRARDLFKLLLINHRAAVTVDDIQEKLWGGASNRNIETLVMNAASHIRNALGIGDNRAQEGGSSERGTSLLRIGEGYRLDLGDDVWVDFVRFKELLVAARRSHTVQERRDLYAEAVALYGGEFLPEDAFAEWSDFQRQILKDAYFEAMEFLMREQLRDGDPDGAIERARRLLAHDDTSEVAYDVLLRGLRERGRLAEARKAYAQCADRYRRAFDSEPPASLRELIGM